jgi:acetyl esterase/lipase
MPLVIDPEQFGRSACPADAWQRAEKLREALAGFPRLNERPIDKTRAALASDSGLFGRPPASPIAEDISIQSSDSSLNLRIYRPPVARFVILHIHGGGFVFGDARQTDHVQESLARSAQAIVISVDYRLAPEFPFPAAQDDCLAAMGWALDFAERELCQSAIGLAGESAGANLAATTLLRLKAAGRAQRIFAAAFSYGMFDLALTPSARNWSLGNLLIDDEVLAWYAGQYAPGRDLGDPLLSPLRAELQGLCPALFGVGTLDPLLDDSVMMAARWASAGQPSELEVYPGEVHGFDAGKMMTEQARHWRERCAAFLARYQALASNAP